MDATPESKELEQALDATEAFIREFVVLPSDWAYTAVTLWVAHAHVYPEWHTTPRLAFMSPEPGSGKTTALEVVRDLIPDALMTGNSTAAFILRTVDTADHVVILLDEVDAVFGSRSQDSEPLRGLINAGYRKGNPYGRCETVGKEVVPRQFDSFAPVALAGLRDLPDTIATRAVIVPMRRRLKTERTTAYRPKHAGRGHAVRDRLGEALAAVYLEPDPPTPDEIDGRDADVWETLVSVADAAGPEWAARARTAAVEYVTTAREEVVSLNVALLRDVRDVFDGPPRLERVRTADLLAALHEQEEGQWLNVEGRPLAPGSLAALLKPYGITPRQVKAFNAKGYLREDFADAWARYLPAPEPPPFTLPVAGGDA